MTNMVLIAEALEHSQYSVEHIRWLIRKGHIAGRKVGGIWLVDLDQLKEYEQQMGDLGAQRHDPHRKKNDS